MQRLHSIVAAVKLLLLPVVAGHVLFLPCGAPRHQLPLSAHEKPPRWVAFGWAYPILRLKCPLGVMLLKICFNALFQLGHDGSSAKSWILTEADRD